MQARFKNLMSPNYRILEKELLGAGIWLQAAAESCAHARVLKVGREPVARAQMHVSRNLHFWRGSKPSHPVLNG